MIARRVRALVLVGLFWTASFADPGPAHGADAIEVLAARLEPAAARDGWLLAADFALPLGPRQEEAINRGVVLPFTVEFELNRPRWYWLDERIAQASRTYRVSYHALTRQYRVASPEGLPRAFDSLSEALATLAHLRGWRVLDAGEVEPGVDYEGRVRIRLDTSLLPKPFQVNAIANRDWTLQAEWKRFRFSP